MLEKGFVLVQPEGVKEEDGAHHVVAGDYETEEQHLMNVDSQCLCGRERRGDIHIPAYQFIGCDPVRIRARLDRLQRSGAVLCATCNENVEHD